MANYRISAVASITYHLVMNSIFGRMEEAREAAGPFDTREEAIAFYNAEKVEPYTDKGHNSFSGSADYGYGKTFRKGGPLENFNPLSEQELETPNRYGHGIHEVFRIVDIEHKVKIS